MVAKTGLYSCSVSLKLGVKFNVAKFILKLVQETLKMKYIKYFTKYNSYSIKKNTLLAFYLLQVVCTEISVLTRAKEVFASHFIDFGCRGNYDFVRILKYCWNNL